MITAYFMAPVRGHLGDAVSPEEKWANVQKGVEIGRAIRRHFPEIDLFIPHEHEEIIDELWRQGLASDGIINATCTVAKRKDFSICYDGDGISGGMGREIDEVSRIGKPIVYIDQISDETEEAIAYMLNEIRKEKAQCQA